jgi:hypothetical protein
LIEYQHHQHFLKSESLLDDDDNNDSDDTIILSSIELSYTKKQLLSRVERLQKKKNSKDQVGKASKKIKQFRNND